MTEEAFTCVPIQGSGTFAVEAVFQTAVPRHNSKVQFSGSYHSVIMLVLFVYVWGQWCGVCVQCAGMCVCRLIIYNLEFAICVCGLCMVGIVFACVCVCVCRHYVCVCVCVCV